MAIKMNAPIADANRSSADMPKIEMSRFRRFMEWSSRPWGGRCDGSLGLPGGQAPPDARTMLVETVDEIPQAVVPHLVEGGLLPSLDRVQRQHQDRRLQQGQERRVERDAEFGRQRRHHLGPQLAEVGVDGGEQLPGRPQRERDAEHRADETRAWE